MTSPRLTRKEQQERTRAALVASGARAVAEKGLHGASIDDIARDAGFTKGAFYANFANKDALFLAILDHTFAESLEDIDQAVAGNDEVADQARDAGLAFVGKLTTDPQWGRVFLELVGHATRDESFRLELVARLRGMRERIAALYEARAAELGIAPVYPTSDVARMTSAMASGVALQRLIDPEAVPEDLFATMLVLFFAGLQAASPAK